MLGRVRREKVHCSSPYGPRQRSFRPAWEGGALTTASQFRKCLCPPRSAVATSLFRPTQKTRTARIVRKSLRQKDIQTRERRGEFRRELRLESPRGRRKLPRTRWSTEDSGARGFGVFASREWVTEWVSRHVVVTGYRVLSAPSSTCCIPYRLQRSPQLVLSAGLGVNPIATLTNRVFGVH